MILDPEMVRRDFPVLGRRIHGRRLVYLDSATTSQKPRAVIEAMREFYERSYASVHRSVHALGAEATDAYEEARLAAGRFVGAPGPVVFTRNATEAINLVAYSWARRHLGPGDEILATEMEHHANLVPWQEAARATGARLRHLPVTGAGLLDLDLLDTLLTDRTRLVCVTGMSNVLGTVVDVPAIAAAAHARGALVLVDGAQLVAHAPVDLEALGADFLAFSAHKMLGPTGIGVLAARPGILDRMDPFMTGGDMIRDVTLEAATWNDPPWKFEAGTPPIAEAVGLAAALEYLSGLGMDEVREHGSALAARAAARLAAIPDLTIYGPHGGPVTGPLVSFNLGDGRGGIIHPHDVGTLLDEEGVAIRVGHHCAKPLMRRFDVPAMCRASFHVYSTDADVEALVRALEKARAFFLGGRRNVA